VLPGFQAEVRAGQELARSDIKEFSLLLIEWCSLALSIAKRCIRGDYYDLTAKHRPPGSRELGACKAPAFAFGNRRRCGSVWRYRARSTLAG